MTSRYNLLRKSLDVRRFLAFFEHLPYSGSLPQAMNPLKDYIQNDSLPLSRVPQLNVHWMFGCLTG